MRRSDREITEFEELIAVMERCDVCRLAWNDEEFPYVLPFNFGMQVEDGTVVLYFHGALEGKKYDLIARDNRAAFEMDCGHELFTEEQIGNCTMAYESVIGQGRVYMVPENEKPAALGILMKHYHKEDFPYNQAVVPRTNVFKLVVEYMTGKRRQRPNR